MFLELKGLHRYTQYYSDRFSERIEDNNEILKSGILWEEVEPELIMLNDFDRFLIPFKEFDPKEQKEEEINRLVEILKSTKFILENTGVKVTNEASIYNVYKPEHNVPPKPLHDVPLNRSILCQ